MSFGICEKHGANTFPDGCCHVLEKVRLGIKPEKIEYIEIHDFLPGGWMCEKCIEKLNRHGFQDYLRRYKNWQEDPSQEELSRIEIFNYFEMIDFQSMHMCEKCFSELTGVEAPFLKS